MVTLLPVDVCKLEQFYCGSRAEETLAARAPLPLLPLQDRRPDKRGLGGRAVRGRDEGHQGMLLSKPPLLSDISKQDCIHSL